MTKLLTLSLFLVAAACGDNSAPDAVDASTDAPDGVPAVLGSWLIEANLAQCHAGTPRISLDLLPYDDGREPLVLLGIKVDGDVQSSGLAIVDDGTVARVRVATFDSSTWDLRLVDDGTDATAQLYAWEGIDPTTGEHCVTGPVAATNLATVIERARF